MNTLNKVIKILFIGAESTGKTTIANHLSKYLDCTYAEEYGRTFCEENAVSKPTIDELCYIGRRQFELENIRYEEASVAKNKVLVCDTSVITTCVYSKLLYKQIPLELREYLPKMKYDFIFLCESDFPYVDDGTRSGEDFRDDQTKEYCRILSLNSSIIRLNGSVKDRLNMILNVIEHGISGESLKC